MAYIVGIPDNLMNFASTTAMSAYDVSVTVNGVATEVGTLVSVYESGIYQYHATNQTFAVNGTTVFAALNGGVWVEYALATATLGNPQAYILIDTATNSISTANSIAAGTITRTMLATGVKPEAIIVASGATVFAGGAVTDTQTVAGAVAGDLVFASLSAAANAVYLRSASLSGTTITYTFSADPGASTINYQIVRVAS
jgi:hypothetical protein